MPNICIEYQCPQCGAPANLEETDRLFVCKYCRVKSYLFPEDVFQYQFPSTVEEGKELLFFPFWRFKGMLFSCMESGIKYRFIDVSHQAVRSNYFPISVGLRSQALKLRFVTPESKGSFLKPSLPFDKMLQQFLQQYNTSLSEPVFHQSFIGEAVSIIHSPFFVNGKVYDAVLNRPVTGTLPTDADPEDFTGSPPGQGLRFAPALCPSCGWDLNGCKDTLVLICENCNSAWSSAGKNLRPLRFACTPHLDNNNALYLPFWRISADISGIELHSYADLVRLANLPKVIQSGWHDIRFRFWVPAFKVPPGTFMRLAHRTSLFQPRDKLVTELSNTPRHAVNLSVKEAVENLKIILAGFIKPQKDFIPRLPEITITPNNYLLVYMPFLAKNLEFVQPKLNLAIQKSQLTLTTNL